MAKVEYKDVPVYFAHEDGASVPSAVQASIDASAKQVTANYKSADTAVKNWASDTFVAKS